MTKPTVTVIGKEEVIAGLDAVQRAAHDLTEPNRRILSRLVPEIAARTPRRTGALAVSWGGGVSSTEATVSSPLPYALPVEVGTVRMAGAHMVSDTLASSSDEIVKEYEDALAQAGARAGFGVTR